jgi:glycosyltransferase involved in cell wall biosynthesis
LPPGAVPCWAAGVKTVGWIADFQHGYLPEFFPREECQRRNEAFRSLVESADLVLLSSRTARDHFGAFAPDYVHKARVAPFPSMFAFEPPSGDPRGSPRKYNLPEKFALVANQFWAHKNHEVVVEALNRVRRKGVHVTVAMTGLLADSRDPSNHALSRLLQAVACGGLAGQVTLLGQVPREDLVDLMRVAAIVIQPSRFEGWSTVVQDAKALGRPVVCSDIPVHREQAPEAVGFFPCDRPDILADLLAARWDALEPGPDLVGEGRALAAEREFAGLYGRTLLGICREAVRA